MRNHVIFDLDGTLVDSVPVSVAIMNAMLEARRAAMRACPDITRRHVSAGGPAMIAAVLGDHCIDPAQDIAEFRARYADMPTPADSLFPGVRAGLEALTEGGLTLAICTNKPQALAEKVLADLNLAAHFRVVVGSRPGVARKPSPELLRLCLEALGADASDCIFIGDSGLDREAAASCGMAYLMVGWGYGKAAETSGPGVARQFGEVLDFITGWRARAVRAA